MQTTKESVIDRNSIFLWIAAMTGFIFLIPGIAMQFSTSVQWGLGDFLLMGLFH